jgi:hypothetical protein
MEIDDDRLKLLLDNFVDKVYIKGDVKYDSYITHNDKWFARREDRRATIFNIDVDVEIDKLFPLSKNYDTIYSKKLKDLFRVNDIKKYFGMPNLVITIEFEWESEENQKFLNEVFRPLCMKMTEETVNNMVNDKKIQEKTGISTKEQFQKIFKLAMWDDIMYDNGQLGIEVVTHYRSDKYGVSEDILKHAMRTIYKYGLQDLEIYNNMGQLA